MGCIALGPRLIRQQKAYFLRDITEKLNAAQEGEQHAKLYRALFDHSPISIWEMDFSAVKDTLDGLRQKGVADLAAYLNEHPDFIDECLWRVKVLDATRRH